MAKFTLKRVNSVADNLESRLLKIAEDSFINNSPAYAKLLVDDIRNQTRAGKDVVNDRRQPPLAKTTIKSRSYIEKYTELHPLYSRRRSNLTVTGQLLDALIYKIKKKFLGRKFEIEVEVNNTVRRSYLSPVRRKQDRKIPRLTNKKLQEYLKDKGREFLGFRVLILERLKRLATQDLRRNIRKALRRK